MKIYSPVAYTCRASHEEPRGQTDTEIAQLSPPSDSTSGHRVVAVRVSAWPLGTW